MKTTYIYNDLTGIHETSSLTTATRNAEEPIIVRIVEKNGRIYLLVIQ